jgi:RNA polymerase sigma-70 factor (ECF subfamily)
MAERDPEAFRALYRAHYRTVCRYLAARTDRDLVEDVAAETFLVAWRRQPDLPEHVVPWLLNAASKCLANQRRSRERAAALAERIAAVAPASAADDVVRAAHRRALIAALAAMTKRDRELLLLHHWDGLAPREAAAVLELAPVLVRSRLHRASRRLQRALRAALEDEDVRHHAIELTAAA